MHFRLSIWAVFLAFGLAAATWAEAASRSAMQPGQIVAKEVTGSVSMLLNGRRTRLQNNDRVSQSATVVTSGQSSVILVFSNGATTELGANTTLVIDEFMQDPFKQMVAVGNLTAEPTTSHTRLRLQEGELVGKVAHLHHHQGSYFTIQTPVGAAGIRGTTFRIVFRPTGTGQAFAVFSLSTVEGSVAFQPGVNVGVPAPAQPAVPPGGVAVSGGQQVVVTVSVSVNAQTGQVSVTTPPVITSTEPISVSTQQSIVNTVQTMVTTAAATTFTPETPTSPTPNAGSTGNSNQEKKTSGTTSTPPPAPPPTTPPPSLTPGAGQGS